MFRKFFNKQFKHVADKIESYDKIYQIDRFPKIPVFKVGLGIGTFAVMSVGTYWTFEKQINLYVTTHGSRIAGDITKSDDVKKSIKVILEDPELFDTTMNLSSHLIKNLCDDPEVKKQLADLLISVLADESFQARLEIETVKFLQRPGIENQLTVLISQILQREDFLERVNELVQKTITNKQNQRVIAESSKQVLSSEETKAGVVNLLLSFIPLIGKSPQK